jgi:RNA polymerase sigma-70 factor, ECF subfamily
MSHSDDNNLSRLERDEAESRLLGRLRVGDPQAFEELHEEYRSRLFRSALRILRNRHDAEDAIQETLIRAFVKINTFDGRSSLRTWLTSILINCCLGQLRKNKRHPLLSLSETGEGGSAWSDTFSTDSTAADDILIIDEQVSALHQVLSGLKPDLRFILIARYECDLTLAEIASRLQLSFPATKSRALRARKLCARSVRLLLLRP